MKNTVYIVKNKGIYVNGVRIGKVRNYAVEQADAGTLSSVKLEFDADDVRFTDEITEAEIKGLYRDYLEKQLAFLKEAQEDARICRAFEDVLAYSCKILELAKEIEDMDRGIVHISIGGINV